MLTLSCTNTDCLLQLRIGRFLKHPEVGVTSLKYCPFCKSRAIVVVDEKVDYWEMLSNSLEMPVELVTMMYQVWDSEEFPKFPTFVKHMMDQTKKETTK